MNLPFFGETPVFLPKDQAGDGLLPWVIGVMLFLTGLATAMGLALGQGLDRWSEGLATTLTVQIVDADAAVRARQTEDALKMLRATPGVTKAEVMADADVMALISPWLGDLPIDAGLPVPTLIHVELDKAGAVNTAGLAERLRATAKGARLDDHQAWMASILELVTALRLLLVGIVVLIVLSTVAIVIFGCRAGLATHRDSIEIMHMMGAEDSMIASAFDRRYLLHGLVGGLGGIIMAILVILALLHLAEEMGQGLLTASLPGSGVLWWLLLLPVIAGAVTMGTARITVRRALLELV
ncbi:cell division protein FtsX [Gimibacter soli]|uniref:Cell division protein n=1 Tax=Gimibacter soli TaxID=3024400 RepID=A0AAF0BI52_9PROT|nr:hypothetical protein [Gimibacter soli]WCL54958.1 hypothetical protein PH603_04195 [Gimibacter soli]